jgi:hypothetical protein
MKSKSQFVSGIINFVDTAETKERNILPPYILII